MRLADRKLVDAQRRAEEERRKREEFEANGLPVPKSNGELAEAQKRADAKTRAEQFMHSLPTYVRNSALMKISVHTLSLLSKYKQLF